MKVLVTGASGFIGSWLVKRLVSDHEVLCLVRKSDSLSAHKSVHVIEQDLAELLDTKRLPASLDAIIHLAQSRHFRQFPDQARDMFKVNTDSTAQLLDYARKAKVRSFILASTGGVCGYQPRPIVETDPPAPINFYVATKYAAECLVGTYSEYFATVILRYFFVYGEGQRNMFMPGLIERVLKGNPVIVAGKTGVKMNPIHASDAVEATARSLELQNAETINVAGAEVTTVLDLAELIGKLTGKQPQCSHEQEKGPMAMVASIERMKFKLGISPKVSLEEGLRRFVKDVTENT